MATPASGTGAEPVTVPAAGGMAAPDAGTPGTGCPADASSRTSGPIAADEPLPVQGTPAANAVGFSPKPMIVPEADGIAITAAESVPPLAPAIAAASQPGRHGFAGTDRRSMRPGDRSAPRAPSNFEIFTAGDHVVYPTHGVGTVEKIGVEEIVGEKLELIHITFEENRMTLRVPVSKARSSGLRKLATERQFGEALRVLKGRARTKRTMWSRRALEYQAKINSGDPVATAEVVRDLYRAPKAQEQSFSERQIYEAAMDRLAGELAALDKTDKPTALGKIGCWLQKAESPPSAPDAGTPQSA
jgi:CarD family transcriptional regulator